MDRISRLPDETLVKILSFLPTKVAVSTSILSKRWECIWMWLPELGFYHTEFTVSERESLHRFLHRSLPLLKAPVLESLYFKFSYESVKPEDMKLWIAVVASRCVRELRISYSNSSLGNLKAILPSSLYTNKSLVSLNLCGEIHLEVVPRNVCLPSLKTLLLHKVIYTCEESLQRLLSICPVLEDLVIYLWATYNKMKRFTVIAPSLKHLTLNIHSRYDDVAGFVINTPSLEYFKLNDQNRKRDYYMIEYMPKLVQADIDVLFSDLNSLIGSITSAKRLTLCHCQGSFHTEVDCGDDFVFNQLEHLKICVCSWHTSNLLHPLLRDSPNLKSLQLFKRKDHDNSPWFPCWNEPTMVPECLLSSLHSFEWSSYFGTPKERDLAVYILKTACCLKTVRIGSSRRVGVPKVEMLKELALSS